MDHYNQEIQRLHRLKEEYTASIPNISLMKRMRPLSMLPSITEPEPRVMSLNAPPLFHNPIFGRLPVAQLPQPVASGSNVHLPTVPGVGYMGAIDDYYGPPDAFMERIGPVVPTIAPHRNANNFDENGDFFGRGRDTFVGPQAKADEYDAHTLIHLIPFSLDY